MKGYISSFESLGCVDGPGIRYVAFLAGCNLRCGCCHNPETWSINNSKEYEAKDIIDKVVRYKTYFALNGGITISGGEPLLQSEFTLEIFKLAHLEGINTCLDTSGSILNKEVKELLKEVDYVLLDVKYTNEELYQKYVGCSYKSVIDFLEYLNSKKITTIIRQVIIPTLNDNLENINNLKELKNKFSCISQIELLPFKKTCEIKYNKLELDFKFKNYSSPSKEKMEELNKLLEI